MKYGDATIGGVVWVGMRRALKDGQRGNSESGRSMHDFGFLLPWRVKLANWALPHDTSSQI